MGMTYPIKIKSIKHLFFVLCYLSICSSMVLASGFESSPNITKSFLVAKSTKSYNEAKKFAKALSLKSGIKIDLRGLLFNADIGLTESKKECIDNGFEYPCYTPRGRYDDGAYISIEYSSAYERFSKGYYVVMVNSGEISKRFLEKIKTYVPDAYVKKSSVYMGCMH